MTQTQPTKIFFIGIWLAAFTGAFEATGLGPSYPGIAKVLTGNSNVAPYVTSFTAFSFASAVGLSGFIQPTNFAKWFSVGTVLQLVGLALCALAQTQESFVAGRAVQGFGEGFLTVAVFYAFVQFIEDARAKARALASVSVAWLTAAAISPIVYQTIEQDPWRFIFWFLFATSLVSGLSVWAGRQRNTADVPAPMWPGFHLSQVKGWGILTLVTGAVFLYAQWSSALPGPAWVIFLGVLVLSGATWLLLDGRLGLRVSRSRIIMEPLLTRGVVSSVYAVAMAFLPVVLYAQLDVPPVVAAIVGACAAVGWTTGALFQSRLVHFRGGSQLASGLAGLFVGLFTMGISVIGQVAWPMIAVCAFAAGAGTGITANSLPIFISDLSSKHQVSTDLSAAESVDTITTTITVATVGVVLGPVLSSPGQGSTALWFFVTGAAMAGIAGIYVFFRGRSISKAEIPG